MPNGNPCKLNFTLFLGTDLAKVRMKTNDDFYSRAEDEHGREVVSSMVHFLRRIAELIEAEHAISGVITDERGGHRLENFEGVRLL